MRQPCWLAPFNKGRRKGSRNKPKPVEPKLICLRFFEPSSQDEELLAAPLSQDETEELMCHLLAIRRQRQRWLRYVKRYQPWRALVRARMVNPRKGIS